MEGIRKLEKNIKISHLNVESEKEINLLLEERKFFIPAFAEFENENVKFSYDISDLKPFKELKKENYINILNTLANVNKLFSYTNEFCFNLNPENLYYSSFYDVMVMERDLKKDSRKESTKQDFILMYKSLIGYMIGEEHEYSDYYYGGISFLKNSIRTEKYLTMTSADEIQYELIKTLNAERKDREKNYVKINKKKLKRNEIITRCGFILSVFLLVYAIITAVFVIPKNNRIIKGEDSFIRKDYAQVISHMEKLDLKNMDGQIKYMLAYSYVAMDNLSEKQKKVIIESIGPNSNENILDFWITLGREEYESALDISKKLENSQLELYALLKYKYSLQTDLSVKGQEKESKISNLDSQIEKIDKQLHPEKYDKNYKEEENNPKYEDKDIYDKKDSESTENTESTGSVENKSNVSQSSDSQKNNENSADPNQNSVTSEQNGQNNPIDFKSYNE